MRDTYKCMNCGLIVEITYNPSRGSRGSGVTSLRWHSSFILKNKKGLPCVRGTWFFIVFCLVGWFCSVSKIPWGMTFKPHSVISRGMNTWPKSGQSAYSIFLATATESRMDTWLKSAQWKATLDSLGILERKGALFILVLSQSMELSLNCWWPSCY